ncbi:hypothetical protein CHLNCDRAFT_51499 [Chlorella variabilis]|uniref:Expansin-like EG45 domain-containing protein n=1 Tax=Chlorella variabilis TaxID=554065 RepID=E1ZC03_CHLVA|nr:hypothetical protein CHLNCDRAFT_51499 [Chlorella variabilis]EFN56727.1 hypothetical protein CHLNCDRAFT_51499 [Chlorella variabilis]|eukprot:XP_005848829.1 hypothetical protein CHLNCDRAFT_51499 [Chlorella variabilis]
MLSTPAALVRSILAGLVLLVATVDAYSGVGTAYGRDGGRGSGACGIGGNLGHWENYYAAMNGAQYGGSCGKCLKVCGAGGCTVVMVVDMCPSQYCGHGSVDMSSRALKESTGYDWDRKPISWSFTSCGGGGGGGGGSSYSNSGGSSKKLKKCLKKCKGGRKGKSCRKYCNKKY